MPQCTVTGHDEVACQTTPDLCHLPNKSKNSKEKNKKKILDAIILSKLQTKKKFKRKKIMDAIHSKLQTCRSTNPLFLSFHPKSFPSHQRATPSLHNLRLPSTPQQQPPPTSDTATGR
jgi:hypothetical protein